MPYNITNLTLREIRALRKSTDFLPITGVDAIFIGTIQVKLNQKIESIEHQLDEENINIYYHSHSDIVLYRELPWHFTNYWLVNR